MKSKLNKQALIENQEEIIRRLINLELLIATGQRVLKPSTTNKKRRKKETIDAIVNDKLKRYLL